MLICDKSGRELRHRILLPFFVVEILTTQESVARLDLQMVISVVLLDNPSVAHFYTGKFARRTIRQTKLELA